MVSLEIVGLQLDGFFRILEGLLVQLLLQVRHGSVGIGEWLFVIQFERPGVASDGLAVGFGFHALITFLALVLSQLLLLNLLGDRVLVWQIGVEDVLLAFALERIVKLLGILEEIIQLSTDSLGLFHRNLVIFSVECSSKILIECC